MQEQAKNRYQNRASQHILRSEESQDPNLDKRYFGGARQSEYQNQASVFQDTM